MRHQILFRSPNLELDYDPIDDYLHARWAAAQTLDSTRAGYEQILVQLRASHCHRLLDDRREAQGIWGDLADWIATDWYPRARAAGLVVHAIVFSHDFFGRLSTELVLARVSGGLIAGFDSEEAARRAVLEM